MTKMMPAKAVVKPPLARLFVFRGVLPRSVGLTVGIGAAILVLAVWSVAAPLGWISPVFLPSPFAVIAALWTMIANNGLLGDAGISIARVWGAFLLSAIMAIPIGILMSSYRILGSALEPMIDFIRYLP